MRSTVTFDGPGPFDLPTAEKAMVTSYGNNGVTVTFMSQLTELKDGVLVHRRPEPEAVSIQMLASVARDLAEALMRAAEHAELCSRPRHPRTEGLAGLRSASGAR